MKRVLIILLGGLLLVGLGVGLVLLNAPTGGPGPKRIGGPTLPPSELVAGSAVPDFTLPALYGDEQLNLAQFRGDKPLVLIFGSFTCDLFCPRTAELEALYQRYKDRAQFLVVYITEAGHKIAGLEFMYAGGLPDVHTPLDERRAKVARAATHFKFTLPGVIDHTDGVVEGQYRAHPLRLLAVNADGRVAFDLGRVAYSEPWDLKKLEEWLKGLPAK